jgi:pimeloyl-ACP methyl ester carboxylesterase
MVPQIIESEFIPASRRLACVTKWTRRPPAQASELPCLVMIPGTLCDQRLFAIQKRKLRGRAHVVLVDYKAMGSLHNWAPTLLKRLPPSFSLAGFSLGGLWALELMRLAPHRVERLALIASNARAASLRGRQKCQKMHRQWKAFGPKAVVQAAMPSYFHHQRLSKKQTGLVESMAAHTRTPDAYTQFAWAGNRPNNHATLAAFGGPVLLVSGQQDPICPRAWQQAMVAAAPHAQWVELPRVGHFVPLEAPARLSHLLAQWLLQPVQRPPVAPC